MHKTRKEDFSYFYYKGKDLFNMYVSDKILGMK